MALALFGGAFLIARVLMRYIPEGRVRRVLSTRFTVVPESPPSKATQWTWRAIFLLIALIIIFKPFRPI